MTSGMASSTLCVVVGATGAMGTSSPGDWWAAGSA